MTGGATRSAWRRWSECGFEAGLKGGPSLLEQTWHQGNGREGRIGLTPGMYDKELLRNFNWPCRCQRAPKIPQKWALPQFGRSLADDVYPDRPLERPATIGMSGAALDHQRRCRAQRNIVFDAVVSLRDKGWAISAIAHETGRDRKTIRQWLLDKQPGTWERASRHPANAFETYLVSRWEEGCRNATQLYREVCGLGYRGEARSFGRWIKARLRDGLSPHTVSNGVQKGPPIGVEEGPPFQII